MANKLVLKKMEVRGLYDLYDYDLDFEAYENPSIRYITAPNGYGKSTLLRLIENFFSGSLDMFVRENLHFDEIVFYLTKYVIRLSQKRIPIQDEKVDDVKEMVETSIEVYSASYKKLIENRTINSKSFAPKGGVVMPQSLSVYLESKEVHMIPDNRLWKDQDKSISRIVYLADLVSEKIKKRNDQLRETFNKQLMDCLSGKQTADDTNIDKLVTKMDRLLSRYHQVGLAEDIRIDMVDKMNIPYLKAYLKAADNALKPKDDVLLKLECLADWVKKCEFVNKHMIFRENDGIIFEMNDRYKTKVLPEELSSGEQQIVVQAIELLFCSKKGWLVLIDEPELSYHVAWQMLYMDEISKIAKLQGLQCIIATHNPQMFNYDWDASIDLFTQQEELKNAKK